VAVSVVRRERRYLQLARNALGSFGRHRRHRRPPERLRVTGRIGNAPGDDGREGRPCRTGSCDSERLDRLVDDEIVIDDAEYGLVVRGVIEAARDHLATSEAPGEVVARAADHLLSYARQLYITKRLRQAREIELDLFDEQYETRAANEAFDERILGRSD
jgi:hypothetical protein